MALVATLLGASAAALTARPLLLFDVLVRSWLALAGVRSRWGQAGPIRLHWLERPGAGPPVVLLHGIGADAERWFPVLPSLLRGRRLLAPSLPGHGRSGAPPAPFGVADLASWMGEWLQGTQVPVDLIGFSLGGWVALRLALSHPQSVRRLVLVSSAGVRFEPPPERRLLLPGSVRDLRDLLAALTVRPLPVPGLVLRDLLRRARPERRWLVDSALRGEGLVEGSLAGVRMPTLVIWGGEDRMVPPAAGRRLAREIPGARGVEIPGCGHLPYWERRREFRRLLEEFLR